MSLKGNFQNRINPEYFNKYRISAANPFAADRPEVFKWNIAGRNPAVDLATTPENIWENGGLVTWPLTAETLDVVSSDANDTFGGSGAQTVIIEGSGEDDFLVREIVQMNGLTPVTSTTNFLRVYRVTIFVGATNLGDITVDTTSGGDVQAFIPALTGSARNGWFRVPDGYTAFAELFYVETSRDEGNNQTVVDYDIDIVLAPGLEVTRFSGQVNSSGGPSFVQFGQTPSDVSENLDLIFVATNATANASKVTMFSNLTVIKNNLLIG